MMNYASSIKHCELENVKSRKSNIQTAPAQQRELQGTPSVTSHWISHPMPATSGSAVRSLLNHPTSLTRRALLLLSVFLLSFGSAWGHEFVPFSPMPAVEKLKAADLGFNESVPSLSFKIKDAFDLATKYGSATDFYIRVDLLDSSNKSVDVGWSFTNPWTSFTQLSGAGYYAQGNNLAVNDYSWLGAACTLSLPSDYSNYKIRFYLTSKGGLSQEYIGWDGSNNIYRYTECEIEYVYEVSFTSSSYVGQLLGTGSSVLDNVATVPDKSTSYEMADFGDAYDAAGISSSDNVYVRIYNANADGSLSDDQTKITFDTSHAGSWTHKTDEDGDYGYVFFGTGLTKEMLEDIEVSVASNYLYTSSNGRVGIVIAKNPFTNLTPAEAASVAEITEEPDWDIQYVYKFKSDAKFEGDETGAEVISETKMVSNVADPVTISLAGDAYRTIIKNKFISNYMTDFYVRWYLQDADGNQIALTSDPFTGDITSFSGSQYTEGKGWSWISKNNSSYSYTDAFTANGYFGRTYENYLHEVAGEWVNDGETGWEKVFKVTVTKPSSITSWADCKIVCVMTNDTGDMDYDSGEILKEPPFKLKYIFNILSAADLDDAFTAGDDSGAETVNKVIEHTATTASVNLNNYFDEIKHKLGDITDLSDFYLRWYLVKNGSEVEDKTVYSTGGQLLSFDGNYDTQSPNLFMNKKEGKIFYEKLHSGSYIRDFSNGDQQGAKNVTFTLPLGDNWSDYKIVCVMTDAATEGGVDAANGNSSFHGVNTSHDVLITEPTIKLKYVFEMKTGKNIYDASRCRGEVSRCPSGREAAQ